jgi:uncharacterized membrane protein YkoI
MNQQTPDAMPESVRRGMRAGIKVALVSAGIAAGAIAATAAGAEAATSSSGVVTAAAATSSTSTANDTNTDRHGAAPVRSDEKTVNSALAAKLKAAALKAVPGGTVNRVESDSGDGVYEAHMTKAGGTEVTVKFDKSGTVTAVESGTGK